MSEPQLIEQKRPIPGEIRGWVVELFAAWRQLLEAELYREAFGDTYVIKQENYWRDRIVSLLDNPPMLPPKEAWERILKQNGRWNIRRTKSFTNRTASLSIHSLASEPRIVGKRGIIRSEATRVRSEAERRSFIDSVCERAINQFKLRQKRTK